MKEEVAQTVVRMDNEDEDDDNDEEDDDADLENGRVTESPVPEAPMDVPAPVSAKKAGRPSKGASRVSTPAKTPKSATKAVRGRKRKAEEDAEEPAAKRSGRGRATAAAAREGIKEASKKRARAPNGTAKEVRLHLRFLSLFLCVTYKIVVTKTIWWGIRHQKPAAVDLAASPRSRRRSLPVRSTRSRRSGTLKWTPIQSRPCFLSSGKATARKRTPGSQRRI